MENDLLMGVIIGLVVASLVWMRICLFFFHRGELSGFDLANKVIEEKQQEFVGEDNQNPTFANTVRKKSKTRTMFGDCDEKGRYGE
jgi:hypothetical protein